MLKNIYVTRKALFIRYLSVIIACIIFLFIVRDNEFKAFLLLICLLLSGVLAIVRLFWRGLDSKKFIAFYTEENLRKRDLIIRYSGIFLQYAAAIMFVIYNIENLLGLVISAVILLPLILESVIFFKLNKKAV